MDRAVLVAQCPLQPGEVECAATHCPKQKGKDEDY